MGGSFNPLKIFQAVLKPVTRALAPKFDAPQPTVTVSQPTAQPAAASAAPTPTATQDSEAGLSNEKALRKGKKSVTVSRATTSSGTGLNV